jgi:outer membrane protein assembly factor BamB
MLAKDLIDRLERLGLLDQEIIDALREQLQQSGARVTPEAVAKLLVDNGQLTTFQATKMIGELRESQYDEPVAAEAVEDLGIAGEYADDGGVMAIEAVDADIVAVEAVPVEAVPVDAIPLGGRRSRPERPSRSTGTRSTGARPVRPRPVQEEKSGWDSFKIYGYFAIVAGLIIGTAALYWLLSREDADTVIAKSDELYANLNYQGAQEAYVAFLDGYGEENVHSSKARVRVVMTELYKAAQFKQEPERAVATAKEKLPAIIEEPGMNDDRGNLAQLLVDIANSITTVADKAKETSRKRELLDKLKEHYELMDDARYMPGNNKVALGAQIKAIEETRSRVERDISRNVRLDESEKLMKEALDKKETKAAFDVRLSLLKDFPELYDNERLQTLIVRASEIQQTLVGASTQLPKRSDVVAQSASVPSIVLTTLAGNPAPELQGETLYVRAGGSVMAFDGENGKLRWRKFVGYSKNLPPVRIPGESGVLLADSQTHEVLRCAADTGNEIWRSKIDEPFFEPICDRSSVVVVAPSGRLSSLDMESGDAKWATQFPQPLETGPGIEQRLGTIYQPGNHSNIYVLDAKSGECSESYYLGHEMGTVSTPPVPLMGHLFVIENATPTYANVHVLRFDEQGKSLKRAQNPFRLIGNVRVSPIIEGRQLIVLTDRGQVQVLDIEPTSEKEQVTLAAELPPFYEQPTEAEMAVGRTSMWITGTRIGQFELQVNTGRVVRKWSLHELDTFIGKPYLKDEVLVHARILRGSSAIRVMAVDPKTGDEIWRTDVGVPIAAIRQAPGGKSFHAITSQAALFELDREALTTGTTRPPLEDPGAESIGIRYSDPIPMGPTNLLMVDQSGGQKILNYEPSRDRQKVREVTMQLPMGKPISSGLATKSGLFLPLDTGRAVLVNPVTGGMNASPFQPLSDPTANITWSKPVLVTGSEDQVVIADSRKKIYRLGVSAQIRELASKDLELPLLGPAAGVGETYMSSASGTAGDILLGFEMSNLNPTFKNELTSRIVWGPATVDGSIGLVQTADGNLRGFDAKGNEKFSTPIGKDTPVGEPISNGEKTLLCLRGGLIISINKDSGAEIGRFDLGQPISSTPLMMGNKMLVPGQEGVVYIVDVP